MESVLSLQPRAVAPLPVWVLLALIFAATPPLFRRGYRFSSLTVMAVCWAVGLISGSLLLVLGTWLVGAYLIALLHLTADMPALLRLLLDRDDEDDEDDDDGWRRDDDDDDDGGPSCPGPGRGLEWERFDQLRAGWGRLPV